MNDGSLRLTIAAPSIRGISGQMNHPCAQPTASLRALVDTGARQLFLALDQAASIINPTSSSSSLSQEYVMKPYRTYFDLMNSGEHLEHLHTYYNQYVNSTTTINSAGIYKNRKTITPTLNLHTDSGLLIAMTCGHYAPIDSSRTSTQEYTNAATDSATANPTRNRQNGLYIQRVNDELVHVDCSPGDLIIMVGAGGEHWLTPKLGGALHAVPHALYVDFDSIQGVSDTSQEGGKEEVTMSRSWYGKMYLPPVDAELQNTNGLTYRKYRERELFKLSQSKVLVSSSNRIQSSSASIQSVSGISTEYLPAACGGSANFMLSSTCDPSTTVMCWMQCMPIVNKSCGTAAVCTDTVTGEQVDGSLTCPSTGGVHACELTCPNSNIDYKPTPINDYCIGPGTSMSMTGFVSIINSDPYATSCFIYLFPSWVLDGSIKVFFACIGTICIGILIHYLTKLKTNIIRQHWFDTYSVTIRWSMVVFVYSIQIFLSYFIMLIAMTFNTELFIMVGVGLTIGYACFSGEKSYLNGSPSGSYYVANTSPEPCCQPDAECFNDDIVTSANNSLLPVRVDISGSSNSPTKYR